MILSSGTNTPRGRRVCIVNLDLHAGFQAMDVAVLDWIVAAGLRANPDILI
jgi:hypothetical protein